MNFDNVTFSGGWTITPPPTQPTAAWFSGGTSGPMLSSVDRIIFASDTTVATIRGPLSLARMVMSASSTLNNGWIVGGAGASIPTPPYRNYYSTVDRITYSTDTNTASVRGSLSSARGYMKGAGNDSYGWHAGGFVSPTRYASVERIEYAIDTATLSTRGSLTTTRNSHSAVGTDIYGWVIAGYANGAAASIVERITYSTDTASAAVRGPLTATRYLHASTGNESYGWSANGYVAPGPTISSSITRIAYQNDTSTSINRGSMATAFHSGSGTGDSNYGWYTAGASSSVYQRLDYNNDTGTASTRGTLTVTKYNDAANSGVN